MTDEWLRFWIWMWTGVWPPLHRPKFRVIQGGKR